jgi:hypothetical protein
VEGKSIPEIGNGFKFAFFTALITYSSQNLFYIARLVWFGALVRMNGKSQNSHKPFLSLSIPISREPQTGFASLVQISLISYPPQASYHPAQVPHCYPHESQAQESRITLSSVTVKAHNPAGRSTLSFNQS